VRELGNENEKVRTPYDGVPVHRGRTNRVRRRRAGTSARFQSGRDARCDEAFNKLPDTVGTGKYPALKEQVASLPDHVIYRPADLTKLGTDKLGVLAWGNGGVQRTVRADACTWRRSPRMDTLPLRTAGS